MEQSEGVIRRCKNIRDHIYPRNTLPMALYTAEVVKLGGPQAVLADLGCGRGAPLIRSLGKSFGRCFGVDLEVDGQLQGSDCTLIRGDIRRIPLPDCAVDVITMVNVIEHVHDPKAAFLECHRILKPGGRVLFITPNKFFPPILASRLLPHKL